MDLSEVMNGLHVLLQKEGHQNKEIFAESSLNSAELPVELADVLSTHCSLGYNIWEMRNREIPGKYWLPYWAIMGLQQKVAGGHLGKLSFGDDVCIFWVLLCPQEKRCNEVGNPRSRRFADTSRRMRRQLQGSPASAGPHHPPGYVFCFGEWRPVQLNIPPAQKVSDKR